MLLWKEHNMKLVLIRLCKYSLKVFGVYFLYLNKTLKIVFKSYCVLIYRAFKTAQF